MELFYYLLFAVVNWTILMSIFKYSTYHLSFKLAVIPLFIFAFFSAFLLYKFNLHSFYLWHIGITGLCLMINYRKQKKGLEWLKNIVTDDELEEKEMLISGEKTLRYHILSSVIYILGFGISFLYFYN